MLGSQHHPNFTSKVCRGGGTGGIIQMSIGISKI